MKQVAIRWILLLLCLVLVGCDKQPARMEHPDDPDGPYSEQIAAAKRLLQQKEDWADRAEWEVLPSGDGVESHRLARRARQPQGTGSLSSLGILSD